MSTETSEAGRWWTVGPVAGLFALFTATLVAGVGLADAAVAGGLQFFQNPAATTNVGRLAASMAVGVVGFLLLQRYDLGRLALQVGFAGYLAHVGAHLLTAWTSLSLVVAHVPALIVPAALWFHPEWYVMDAGGLFFGGTMTAALGVSLGVLPALLALVGWAAYDAYAVYRSDAMRTLGAAGLDLKIPGAFWVPTEPGATLRGTNPLETDDDTGFTALGVGDAMVPGLLVVSASRFLDAPAVVAGLNEPAVGAFLGALVGFVGLQYVVRRFEGLHAGLPVLNAVTIVGYLAGAFAAGLSLATALGV